MTTVNGDTGRILWSQQSKYYLVRLIKENIIIVSPDVSAETMAKKEEAWKNIEETFAADGMQCQLSKIKRLWKRMKDTARQNITKYNEQKRIHPKGPPKSLKLPTDLDYQVAKIIAHRNMSRNKPRPCTINQLPQRTIQNSYVLNGTSDEDNSNELDQREPDVLEPMTILEEMDKTDKADSVIDISNDNDESNDYVEPANHHGEHYNLYSTNQEEDLESELLPHEIRLRIIQRQNEKERMNMERELYRKKSILLDLQIKKANLEIDVLMRSNR